MTNNYPVQCVTGFPLPNDGGDIFSIKMSSP